MPDDPEPNFPKGTPDECELLLRWLRYLRGAVIRKIDGLSESDARWTPEGGLTPLIGIVNHLTHVEWRWIDGAMLGVETSRSEAEFTPGPELTVDAAITLYRGAGRGDRLRGLVDRDPFAADEARRRHRPALRARASDQRDRAACGSCRRDAAAARRHDRRVKLASPIGELVVTRATASDAPAVRALRDELRELDVATRDPAVESRRPVGQVDRGMHRVRSGLPGVA